MNVVEDVILLMIYPTKLCVPNKTKYKNVKVFNMITNINEVKTTLKHFSCDWKFKLKSPTCNSN